MVDYVTLYIAFPTVTGILTLVTLCAILCSKICLEDDNGFLGDVVCYCFSKTIQRDDNTDNIVFLKTQLPRKWTYWCFFAASLWISLVFVFAWFSIWDLTEKTFCGNEASLVLNETSDSCQEINLNRTSRDDRVPDPTVCNGTSAVTCTLMVNYSHAGAVLAIVFGVMSFVDVQVYMGASCVKRIRITPCRGLWNCIKIFLNSLFLFFEIIATATLPILFPVLSYVRNLEYVSKTGVKDIAKEFFIFFRWTETKEETLAVLVCGVLAGACSLVTLIITCCCAYNLAPNAQPRPAGRDQQSGPGEITNPAFHGIQ